MQTRPIPFFLMVAVITAGCRDHVRIYEIPEGFQGWVVVTQGSPCTTSTTTSDRTTIAVKGDGSACTDVTPAPKSFYRQFYFVDREGQRVRELRATGWGKGGEIWGESAPPDGREYRFFVGREEKFRNTYEAPAR
jgi:hypothetical protein